MADGVCPVCGRKIYVTAQGVIRQHGYARGSGDPERCAGSGMPPSEMLAEVRCPYCVGVEGRIEHCEHCNATGKIAVGEMGQLDAVLVVKTAFEEDNAPSTPLARAATAVGVLMEYGFIHDPEEAPNPKRTGFIGRESAEVDSLLFDRLMEFYRTWAENARGPQKPIVTESFMKVEEALNKEKS